MSDTRAPSGSKYPQSTAGSSPIGGFAAETIGRLKQRLDDAEARIRVLEEEKMTLNAANEAMHERVSRADLEIKRAENREARLIQDLRRLNEEVDDLRDKLAKAQKTIKVQSDQIAAPNTRKPSTTPHHPAPPGAFGHVYNQPPPPFNPSSAMPPPVMPPPAYGAASSYQQPPMSRQQSSIPGIAAAPQSFYGTTAVSTHSPFGQAHAQDHPPTHTSTYGPTPAPFSHRPAPYTNPFADTRAVAPPRPTNTTEINLLPEISPFFNLVERWARNYANVPDKVKDASLTGALRLQIMQHTNPQIAFTLLSTGGTRFFAVAKIMNNNIVNFAFRSTLVRGFRPDFDARMGDLRGDLRGEGKRSISAMPIHMRRASLQASVELVKEMMATPGWNDWVKSIIDYKTTETWSLLDPLFAPGVARNEAFDELKHIWTEALRIGLLMMQKTSLFAADFPPTGANSYFNPGNMVNRDLGFKENPMTLGNLGLKVRLAVTPVMTESDFSGDLVAPRNLHFANVLLQY